MTGDHRDRVGFDFTAEHRLGLRARNALTQRVRHALHVVLVQLQLLANRAIRQIQAHEVQTQHPAAQRPMVTRQDRPRQLVEPAITGLAAVCLPLGRGRIPSLPGHRH